MAKRWTRVLAVVLSIVALVLALAGCQSAAPASGPKPIVIGGALGTTGAAAMYAQAMQRGVDVAVNEINAAGGIDGRPVVFKQQDTASNKTQAVAVYQKQAADPDVLVLIGANASAEGLAVTAVANQVKLPFVSPGMTAVVSPNEDSKYSFRIAPTAPQAVQLATAALKQMGVKRVALIGASDDDASIQPMNAFKAEAPKQGIEIVKEVTYLRDAVDLSPQLTEIKSVSGQIDAIVAPVLADALARMLKRGAELGIKTPWVSPVTQPIPSIWDASGGAALGMTSLMLLNPASTSKVVQGFVSDYKAKYGTTPGDIDGLGYDSALLVFDGIKRAGKEPTRDSIQKAMSTASIEGVTGSFSFKPGSGLAIRRSIGLGKVIAKGQFVAVSK